MISDSGDRPEQRKKHNVGRIIKHRLVVMLKRRRADQLQSNTHWNGVDEENRKPRTCSPLRQEGEISFPGDLTKKNLRGKGEGVIRNRELGR